MPNLIDTLFGLIGMIGPHKVTMDLDRMTPEQRLWHENFRAEKALAERTKRETLHQS